MRLLAIDAGTTAVKAAIVDPGGEVASVGRVDVPRAAGQPLDPQAYWLAVADAIRSIDRADDLDGLEGVVVAGQGQGLWSLDAAGDIAGPVWEWNSPIAADTVTQWERTGVIDSHYRRAGTVLWPGVSAALWPWLQSHDPVHAARVDTTLCAKDFINNRLCGAMATDRSDATIPFIDMDSGGYNTETFAALGCPDLEAKMPPLRDVGEQIGTVTAEASQATGLPVGLPVLMGCMDVVAMTHGTGAHSTNHAVAVLGTTAAVMVRTDRWDGSGEVVGATLKLDGSDRFLRVLGASSGTSTLDWYRSVHGLSIDDFWNGVRRGVGGVLMLPYLAGERVPFLAPDATGTFIGLTRETTQADMSRAVALGVTFSLRHCLESASTQTDHPLVLTGGGASSADWCQLVADVTGRTVVVDERPHVSCVGLAALVRGEEPQAVPSGPRYTPQASYDEEFARFVLVAEQMRPIWAQLATASSTPHRVADTTEEVDT